MTIVKRSIKGTALTYDEMDENIRDLYEDTTIDRVLGNGNTTTKNITVGNLAATTIDATTIDATTINGATLNGVTINGTVETLAATTITATTINGTTINGNLVGSLTTNSLGIGVSPSTATLSIKAGTATSNTAPLKFISGTNLTIPENGVVEYDGNNFYLTGNNEIRDVIKKVQQFQLSTNGSAIGPTVGNFFGANSAASLNSSSNYDIEIFCHFLKSTAGTLTWRPTYSNAVTLSQARAEYTPITGFTTTTITGAMVLAQATQNTATEAAFATTGTLSDAVNHTWRCRIFVSTNLACNFRLNVTQSAGTLTPLAGSFYTVRKVISNSGTFSV